jgi:hypothetical protein
LLVTFYDEIQESYPYDSFIISRYSNGALEDISALTGLRGVLMATDNRGDPYVYCTDGVLYHWSDNQFTKIDKPHAWMAPEKMAVNQNGELWIFSNEEYWKLSEGRWTKERLDITDTRL